MIFVILFAIFLIWLLSGLFPSRDEREIKRAGKIGEEVANRTFSRFLKKGDILLKNIPIESEGQETEIDSLIINSNGIFIIEVKNYNGRLYGKEEDSKWTKVKRTPGGNEYEKTVDNPIRQVKREVYILSRFLKTHHINVWIDGYVYFINGNSPVDSKCIIDRGYDIDPIIHKPNDKPLSKEKIDKILELLK